MNNTLQRQISKVIRNDFVNQNRQNMKDIHNKIIDNLLKIINNKYKIIGGQ